MNKQMKIAFLVTGFSKESKEATKITTLSLAKKMIEKGQEVSIITESRKGLPSFEELERVKVYRSEYGKIMSYPLALKKAGSKFDIIHGFSAAPVLITRSLLSKFLFNKRAKVIHTLKSYSKSYYGNKFFKSLNLADGVTVPTNEYSLKLVNNGVKKERIKIIRSHIDLNKFQPLGNSEKINLKNKLNFPDKKIIIYYGATWENKGFGDLLSAFKLLLDKRKDIFLVAAPRYELEQINKDKIKELGLENNMRIVNELIDVPAYLNSADICVLPYHSLIGTEGNPSCLLEAMACKTPVVTTNVPEIKEIVSHNQEVLMAIPGDQISIADQINKVLDDDQLRERLVEKAYLKSKEFDIEIIAEEFLELYEDVLNKVL